MININGIDCMAKLLYITKCIINLNRNTHYLEYDIHWYIVMDTTYYLMDMQTHSIAFGDNFDTLLIDKFCMLKYIC